MKTWKSKPTNTEIKALIQEFTNLLKLGNLESAKNLVQHKFNDWESSIWSLWQDTYLIYLEDLDKKVSDESFEAKLWKSDLTWLKALEIEDKFNWDGNYVSVNIIYEDEFTDTSMSFVLEKNSNGYILTLENIS